MSSGAALPCGAVQRCATARALAVGRSAPERWHRRACSAKGDPAGRRRRGPITAVDAQEAGWPRGRWRRGGRGKVTTKPEGEAVREASGLLMALTTSSSRVRTRSSASWPPGPHPRSAGPAAPSRQVTSTMCGGIRRPYKGQGPSGSSWASSPDRHQAWCPGRLRGRGKIWSSRSSVSVLSDDPQVVRTALSSGDLDPWPMIGAVTACGGSHARPSRSPGLISRCELLADHADRRSAAAKQRRARPPSQWPAPRRGRRPQSAWPSGGDEGSRPGCSPGPGNDLELDGRGRRGAPETISSPPTRPAPPASGFAWALERRHGSRCRLLGIQEFLSATAFPSLAETSSPWAPDAVEVETGRRPGSLAPGGASGWRSERSAATQAELPAVGRRHVAGDFVASTARSRRWPPCANHRPTMLSWRCSLPAPRASKKSRP